MAMETRPVVVILVGADIETIIAVLRELKSQDDPELNAKLEQAVARLEHMGTPPPPPTT